MATTTNTLLTEAHDLQATCPDTARASHESRVWDGPGRTIDEPSVPKSSNVRIATTIVQLASINLLSSFTNGVITVGLPTIARDISLARELYLWPISVFGLTCGSMLLMAGSIADVVGARRGELVGCFMLGVFSLACGLGHTEIRLTLFRAFQGVAMAIHLPATVSIVTATIPKGKARNMAFAALGFARDIGYSVGLVLGGVLIQTSGWRLNFYLAGGAMLIIATVAVWGLPKEKDISSIIISGGLALLTYVLAVISADLASVRSASTSALLATSLVLLIAFPFWMSYRERHGKPALIPNSLWKHASFASTCVILAMSNGVVIAMELFSSLYFQEIQDAGTFTTSLQLLPNVVVGVVIGLSCGLFVDKVAAGWLVTLTSILCACAPLLMAVMDPKWTYWYVAFWAQALSPFSVDVLVTVGMLIVSDVFPDTSQALAGAVFNTVGQFGLSFGVGLCQLVASAVTGNQGQAESSELLEGDTLLRGYRASFWTMHGFMLLCTIVALFGLRRVGKVGLKRD
ncbi:uncharacterized protein Z518_05978 [Rhinocladiella mackenziei CBS 650.93]|uniref:Major facilitator superfamily (MFS) profile domain-containing protein n=1 Tax=Rhinocladiella mackenziei CBS 650.93 TaxID=1442369 RepID=A0A0D2IPM9_9EURO|nr:uncharacterized protein Z518_05978 [Rhinocladiella mackenziei CBS 650.93]KIX05106.1 hypothetical protein Z518_05978 [Rhinocladiella mackenziei CBS 650.93]